MSTLKELCQQILTEKTNKILPAKIEKDWEIFDITGTLESSGGTGDVKLFDTIDNMQADPNPKEGDKAIVYNSPIQNWSENTVSKRVHFPDSVSLPSAITEEYFYGGLDSNAEGGGDVYASVSLNGMLEETYNVDIMVHGSGLSEITIKYTSSDNQHFTKVEGDSDIELPIEVQKSSYGNWDNRIGYFIQTASPEFNGLFEYKLNYKTNKMHPAAISTANVVISSGNVSSAEFTSYINAEYDVNTLKKVLENSGLNFGNFFIDTNDDLKFIDKGNTVYIVNSSGQFIGVGYTYSNNSEVQNATVYDVDLVNKILTNPVTYNSNTWTYTSTSSTSYNKICWYQISTLKSCHMSTTNDSMKYSFSIITQNGSIKKSIKSIDLRVYDDTYIPMPTQLDATSEYVYEKVFLGKNGTETGTLTDYTSISLKDVDAEVYAKIQAYYDTLTPITLNSSNNVYSDFTTKYRDCKVFPTKTDGTPFITINGVTNLHSMFSSFNYIKTIPSLNTANVTIFQSMFDGCRNLSYIPNIDTSSAIYAQNMFANCCCLTNIPNLNTSKVTTMYGMFYNCQNLTTIPNLDMSNVQNVLYMFSGCNNLVTIPNLNTSKVNKFDYMFEGCDNLDFSNLSGLDTSKATSVGYMFRNCANMTDAPMMDTSNVVNIRAIYQNCINLVNVPALNTSKVNSFDSSFYNCFNLVNIPALNTNNVLGMSYAFTNCINLSNQSLDNILSMCASATKYNYTKTLKSIGLTQNQANICTTLPNYSACISAGWSTGY